MRARFEGDLFVSQLILLASSVQQLDRCLPLLAHFGSTPASTVTIWVIAEAKSSLAAYANRCSEQLSVESRVQCVTENETDLLHRLSQCRHVDWFVMPYAGEQQAFFSNLFERSPCRTMLLDPGAEFSGEVGRIVELLNDESDSIGRICRANLKMAERKLAFDAPDELTAADSARRRELLVDRLAELQLQSNDLVVTAVQRTTKPNGDLAIARQLLDLDIPATVVILRHRMGWVEHTWSSIEKKIFEWSPPMEREARMELAENLADNSSLQFEFVAMMCAATCLAAFGLVQNSAAVIIGAMLVAPLMTPIMGAGLALAYGNRPLFGRAGMTVGVGFLCALATSFLFGLLVRMVQGAEVTPEMWARSNPSILDFLVGLVGGSAAAYARTRSHLSSALAGAAIAAALVPPVATAGLQLAFLPIATTPTRCLPVTGPLLLFTANVLTIMVGSSFILWLSGIRGDHRFGKKQRWANRALMLLLILTSLVLVVVVEH